jgi:hypothetical protein
MITGETHLLAKTGSALFDERPVEGCEAFGG